MSPPALLGTYAPPALRVGGRTTCLYRDAECVVTSWTDAPIPWPRVQPIGQRGGSGLLVDETLLRAIRTESVKAMMHHFGVGNRCVWCWRHTIGISQVGTEGSRRLVTAAGAKGADATRGKERSEEYCDNLSRAAKGRRIKGRWTGREWSPEMDARLGTEDDGALAEEFGKTANAVRVRRAKLGIPSGCDHRKKEPGPKRRTRIPLSICGFGETIEEQWEAEPEKESRSRMGRDFRSGWNRCRARETRLLAVGRRQRDNVIRPGGGRSNLHTRQTVPRKLTESHATPQRMHSSHVSPRSIAPSGIVVEPPLSQTVDRAASSGCRAAAVIDSANIGLADGRRTQNGNSTGIARIRIFASRSANSRMGNVRNRASGAGSTATPVTPQSAAAVKASAAARAESIPTIRTRSIPLALANRSASPRSRKSSGATEPGVSSAERYEPSPGAASRWTGKARGWSTSDIGDSGEIVDSIRADNKRWVDFMMRFELGLEEPEPQRARNSALTSALSYIAGGMVPVAPRTSSSGRSTRRCWPRSS